MKRHDKLPLKKAYYRIFTGMIVIPLVLVLVLSLVILGMQYREQAIENIRGVQKGVAAELQSDVDFMSMRLYSGSVSFRVFRLCSEILSARLSSSACLST